MTTPGSANSLSPVAFVMGTDLGWKTVFENWRRHAKPTATRHGIQAVWMPVPSMWDEHLHGKPAWVPTSVRWRLRTQFEIARKMRANPSQALFLSSLSVVWPARRLLDGQPYFIFADSTRRQLYGFGEHYRTYPSRWAAIENYRYKNSRRYFRRAAAVFGMSRWACDGFINDYGVDPTKVHVLNPGIEIGAPPLEKHRSLKGPVRILFVGGDFSRKGGDLLLRWAETTKSRGWEIHIVTASKIKSSHPNVVMHGELQHAGPEIRELFERADIFALPTRADCYSIAAIEALSRGMPVVITRVGGCGEIVEDAQTGYVVKPDDFDGFSERLDLLVSEVDLRISLGKNARRAAELRFDVNHCLNPAFEIMQQVLHV